ncbi:hypothetical protein D3C87_1629460 [compost metagenome]
MRIGVRKISLHLFISCVKRDRVRHRGSGGIEILVRVGIGRISIGFALIRRVRPPGGYLLPIHFRPPTELAVRKELAFNTLTVYILKITHLHGIFSLESTVNIHTDALFRNTFFGRDQQRTVCCAATVQRGRRGASQYVDRLDVVGVNT